MKNQFNNIVVICRRNNANSVKTLLGLIKYLKSKKIQVFIEEETSLFLSQEIAETISINQIGKRCDLVAAVGGDGSFLSAARIAAKQKLPIIGINRGSLGFLTDINLNSIDTIGEILRGEFQEEERILLNATITSSQPRIQSLALNEIAFLSHNTGHIIELLLYLDNQFSCNYRADGLIVTTPTGSTAHALSSGGPILYPTVKNIALVPILSHNLSSRPIVIDSNTTIEIKFEKSKQNKLLVICDGHTKIALSAGTIQIKKAREKLKLLHPKHYNYFEILRTKLHWEKEPNLLKSYADTH